VLYARVPRLFADLELAHGDGRFISFEELTQYKNDLPYKQMLACLRSAVPNIPMRVRATTNPDGPDITGATPLQDDSGCVRLGRFKIVRVDPAAISGSSIVQPRSRVLHLSVATTSSSTNCMTVIPTSRLPSRYHADFFILHGTFSTTQFRPIFVMFWRARMYEA
jgi:hypothetical protein